MKIISTRTALNNRQKYEKSELLRFVITVNGIKFDKTHSLPGRGYYLSKDFIFENKVDLKKNMCSLFKYNLKDEDIIVITNAILKEREEKNNG